MQLTSTEYSTWYTKALKLFAASQQISWEQSVYKVRKGYKPYTGKMLFLFAYALSTWEHDDSATNYLTEKEVITIINKLNQATWN